VFTQLHYSFTTTSLRSKEERPTIIMPSPGRRFKNEGLTSSSRRWAAVVAAALLYRSIAAFAPPPPPREGRGGGGTRRFQSGGNSHGGGDHGGAGGGAPPPPPGAIASRWDFFHNGDEDGAGRAVVPTGTGRDGPTPEDEEGTAEERPARLTTAATGVQPPLGGGSPRTSTIPRGGGAAGGGGRNDVLRGGKTVLARASQFWTSTADAATARVRGAFQSKQSKREDELLHQLRTMAVRQVSVPNSTVLPPEVIRMAVKRSGMVGQPLRTDRVQELARNLKRWYVRQGYVLHSVTGATLKPETATAEITVEEPVVSGMPVNIVVCREMVIDEETGEAISLRQFRKRRLEEQKMAVPSQRPGPPPGGSAATSSAAENFNTTLVPTRGRTRATRVAKALGLHPGQPFQWSDERWRKIASSGVFSKILRASPERTTDGGVCLQVYAMEPPARHLEYGIGKSIWTNSWEGEVDFDWRNLFGGGESVGVLVRRGTKDAAPSIRIKYGDDKFGLEGGYDVEVFSDFLGDTATNPSPSSSSGDNHGDGADDFSTAMMDELDQDSLLNRRGATVRLRNPISPNWIANSVASASVERTSTTTGRQESIGSATLTLGPFRRLLPLDARTSITSTLTGGTRFRGIGSSEGPPASMAADSSSASGKKAGDDLRGGAAGGGFSLAGHSSPSWWGGTEFLPYSSASATARQILPISVSASSTSPSPSGGRAPPPITLAFQHTVSTATPNIPRHEARAMANAAQIRGASPDGPAAATVRGTTEVRVPVAAPIAGSGTVVLFGDWFVVQPHQGGGTSSSSPFYTKSSIGIGLRKTVQGLPLKYDFCYSSEGKFKSMFGLGPDFDV
jgi:hypothetical protein